MSLDENKLENNNLNTENNDESSNSENSGCDTNRRDFLGLVGAGCGVACLCYAGYKAVDYMAPSEDAKADATLEVDISSLKEGDMMTVKWRGKPVFIKRRTADEIKEAEDIDIKLLPDPEADSVRVSHKRKDILVVIGICTHLGCVPLAHQGDYDGWFCPCHGSHYDTSGRVRLGPAPKNLVVPQYHFASESKIVIGAGHMNDHMSAWNNTEKSFLM